MKPALASERATNEAALASKAEKDIVKEISVGEYAGGRGVFLCRQRGGSSIVLEHISPLPTSSFFAR